MFPMSKSEEKLVLDEIQYAFSSAACKEKEVNMYY
jgi:hypothetical protein